MKISPGTKVKKHIFDLNSWSFPAAVMGILGLYDQKFEKENAEEHTTEGSFPQLCPIDTITCILKFSSIFCFHLQLARLPPLHQTIAVAIG